MMELIASLGDQEMMELIASLGDQEMMELIASRGDQEMMQLNLGNGVGLPSIARFVKSSLFLIFNFLNIYAN